MFLELPILMALGAVVVFLLLAASVALGAGTAYDSDGQNAQFDWSDLVTYENRNRGFFMKNKFGEPMKEGDFNPFKAERAPVAYVDNLTKGDEGDRVRFMSLRPLQSGNSGSTTAMVFANAALEGNEEDIRQGDMDVYVDQVRGATGFIGRVSAIRNKLLRNSTIKKLLMDLCIEWMEEDHFYAIYNSASQHLISGGQYSATAHPNRLYATRSTSDPTLLQPDDKLSGDLLDLVTARWKYRSAPLRYTSVGGKTGIIGLISEVQEMALKTDPKFWELQKDAIQRERDSLGDSMHPLFSNAGYMYGDIYLYVTSRVFTGDRLHTDLVGAHGANDHMAIFLGSQALFCAHAGVPTDGMPDFPSESVDKEGNVKFYFNTTSANDFGNVNYQSVGFVYGYKRADFTRRQAADDNAAEATSSTYNGSSLLMITRESGVIWA